MTFNQNFPAMFFNDTVTGGKTESGPFFFGGKKRIEYLVDDRLRYAHPGIRYLYPGKVGVIGFHLKAQDSSLGHGLDGIDQEIKKNLLQLAEISLNFEPPGCRG